MNFLYPYDTLMGDVVVTITRVEIDGREPTEPLLFPDRREVELRDLERRGWETATLLVEVVGPGSELGRFDESDADLGALVVLHCAPSNSRQTVRLSRSDEEPARWSGWIEVNRSHWYERIELRSFMTATVEDIPHRIVGTAEPWMLHLDDRERSSVHGSIRVRWEDFTQPDVDPTFLRQYREDPWYVILDPDEPILYLNQGFIGLEPLLGDRRRRDAAERVLHDQTRASIAAEVWIAMFNSAMAGVERVEDTIQWPDGWREVVLRALLTRMYPESNLEDAVEELWRSREQPNGIAEVQQLLLPAAAQQVGAPKLLRKGITTLGTEERREESSR